jgi:hypothetical protein
MQLLPGETFHASTPGGRLTYRLRSLLLLLWASVLVTVARLRHGPRLSAWTWSFESATTFLRLQEQVAFGLPTIAEQREYPDALVFRSPALAHIQIEADEAPSVKGRWFVPHTARDEDVVLYLHGGGYAFSAHTHKAFPSGFTKNLPVRALRGTAPSVPSSYLFNEHIRYNRYYICMLHQGDPNV